jgi:hypothetical protein
MKTSFMCGVLLLLCACSGGESGSGDHVWKEQTDMIDKAHDAEDLLGSANAQQRQRIEEQTQ